MAYLHTKKSVIFYDIVGDPTSHSLLLLNGIYRTSKDFHMFAKHLWHTYQQSCVMMDHRDSGGQTQGHIEVGLEDLIEDAAAVCALSSKPLSVFGISMGGMVAQGLAWKYPQKVKHLILAATSASAPIHLKPEPTEPSEEAWTEWLRFFVSDLFFQTHTRLIQAMAKHMAADMAADMATGIENPLGSTKKHRQRQAVQAFHLTPEQLRSIHAPTQIFHGTEDKIIPISEGRYLAKHLPNSTLHPLEGQGHLLLAESSKKLADLCGLYLRTSDTACL